MPSATLAPGLRFGDYRLIRQLGKGGFAEVWEAESEVNGRRVALKILTELRTGSDKALERFQQEGRLAASLTSPSCVYVFDAGAHQDLPYIAMELMPGGTLADRIAEHPLAPREAVDHVLDVLDGLETAQRVGILHRDVKPSNVFLDGDGRARIGDFGISKSLEVDSGLSQTGAFLGTPYYASPEQIAAEPLDLRSDLYSVGAMLYELVTGKVPYAGTNASQVLAQVLTRDPVPFAQHAAQVPPGLQRVILRLLAKPREKRYQSYEQARAALLPFSSRGLAVARPVRRFGAIVTDFILFLPMAFALSTLQMAQVFSGRLALAGVLVPAMQFVYFTLTERFWGGGASVGKRLFGLRVTTRDGTTPSFARVALRTVVFLGLYTGPGILFQVMTDAGVNFGGRPLLQFLPVVMQLGVIGLIVSTMRARNGYAGLHELASGTRVMALAERERPAAVAPAPLELQAAGAAPVAEAFGPYQVSGTVWRRGDEALIVARDEELRRDVWVHVFGSGTAVPPAERLRERGAGSLPWLQRGTAGPLTWDAYGAPPGTAFVPWAVSRGGLAWREMREVLDTLARELAARFEHEGTAGVLSPGHVWVDLTGRALLLDFPAEVPAPGGAGVEVTPATWRDFLAAVTALGFAGRANGPLPPRAPIPEYARGILAGLSGGTGQGAATDHPIAELVRALEAVAMRPAEVSRMRRAAPFAVLATVPAIMLLLRFAIPFLTSRMPPWYRDLSVRGSVYLGALQHADSTAAGDSTAARTASAIRIVLSDAVTQARRTPQVSSSMLAGLPSATRAVLDSAVARFPAPDSQTVAAARAWLAVHVPVPMMRSGVAVVPRTLAKSFTALGYLGVAGVLLALLLRGGLLFGLFGVAVQQRDGRPAGRLRCLARALVAWSPLLLLVILAAAPTGLQLSFGSARFRPPTSGLGMGDWTRGILIALAVAGIAIAVWRPARGLAERLTGTVLVPR
jgi:uncharacterized RDD family membrane protein YckC